jgi:phage-related protein
VLDSLGNIALGAVGVATGFIVGAMKLIIPVILDFFAKLLNIGGIVEAIKNIINKIVGPVHKAIDKMVDWLKGILNKVVDKVKGVFGKKEEKSKTNANIDPEKQKALHIFQKPKLY